MQRRNEKPAAEWWLTRIGNATGSVLVNEETYGFCPGVSKGSQHFDALSEETKLFFKSERGKLGDTEDSFLFLYTVIQPDTENFTLSASLTLADADRYPGWQAGFGIFAVDTIASTHGGCRFRNLISVGRHRGLVFDEYTCGIRAVCGHTEPDAVEGGSCRRLDASRSFPNTGLSARLKTGETARFTLNKTDTGFSAEVYIGHRKKQIRFPGCDFLTVQDKEHIYVGIGVAGQLSVQVDDLIFKRFSGKNSHTPESAIQNRIPDYPFPREMIKSQKLRFPRRKIKETIYAAPHGNAYGKGTVQKPYDLQTALWLAGQNSEIILMNGVYYPSAPYLAPKWTNDHTDANVLLHAVVPETVILDGSCMSVKAPIFILRGNGWQIKGLTFQHGMSVGLMVCGSRNTVEQCVARENGDTGILICSYPGTQRTEWPEDNTVSCCDSYRNCDNARCNADGFGAKLSIGEGNRFFQCIAHHNIDDGFDLYTKRSFGPIGAVDFDECIAYQNGRMDQGHTSGSGFKLGGEGIQVLHSVRNCLAYGNRFAGFHSNSNPTLQLQNLISWANGENRWRDNYLLNSCSAERCGTWEKLQPEREFDNVGVSSSDNWNNSFLNQFVHCDMTVEPTRNKDGSIDRHGLFVMKQQQK